MKTQIVHIEPFDDLSSIEDRLNFVKASRVLLVWPESFEHPVDRIFVTRLKRAATRHGLQPGIVCSRKNGLQHLAEKEHIPVFNSITEAQQASWQLPLQVEWQKSSHSRAEMTARTPDSTKSRTNPPRWVFVRKVQYYLCIVIGLGLILVLLPGAKVTVRLPAQVQRLTIPFYTSPSVSQVELNGGVPSKVQTIQVEGITRVKTTGRVMFPTQTSTGTVLVTNLTNHIVNVPIGTVVATDEEPVIRFTTTVFQQLSTEAGKVVEIPVQAVFPGETGNLAAGKIKVVEGDLGLQIIVNNPLPTSGGASQEISAATDVDYQTSKKALLEQLSGKAYDQVHQKMEKDDLLLTIIPDPTKAITENTIPQIGEPGTIIQISVQGTYDGIVVARSALVEISQEFLNLELPQGYGPGKEGIQFGEAQEIQTDADGKISWKMSVSRKIYPTVESNDVKSEINGRPVGTASQMVKSSFPEGTDIKITTFPSFWPWMPIFPDRTTLVFEEGSIDANSSR